MVTITGIADGAAWERLARRAQTGDLRPWLRELDNLRHEATGQILLPVDWSPLQEVDLATVPTDAALHPLSLFMGDTGWPAAPLDDYIRMWDEVAHGSYKRREAMLWQEDPRVQQPTRCSSIY